MHWVRSLYSRARRPRPPRSFFLRDPDTNTMAVSSLATNMHSGSARTRSVAIKSVGRKLLSRFAQGKCFFIFYFIYLFVDSPKAGV